MTTVQDDVCGKLIVSLYVIDSKFDFEQNFSNFELTSNNIRKREWIKQLLNPNLVLFWRLKAFYEISGMFINKYANQNVDTKEEFEHISDEVRIDNQINKIDQVKHELIKVNKQFIHDLLKRRHENYVAFHFSNHDLCELYKSLGNFGYRFQDFVDFLLSVGINILKNPSDFVIIYKSFQHNDDQRIIYNVLEGFLLENMSKISVNNEQIVKHAEENKEENKKQDVETSAEGTSEEENYNCQYQELSNSRETEKTEKNRFCLIM